ncbi:MAG TPA: gamma-glutamylcyclotransferase family protein [Pyrinomonadaceae bacterium]|jgi:hypothetical protein
MDTYIFGYGSLMEKASRTRTEPKAVNAYPAIVKGFQRGWYNHDPLTIGFQPTFLGVKNNENMSCNGVIFPVTGEQATRFDDREKGYSRQLVSPTDITMLDGRKELKSDSIVIIYVTDSVEVPSFQYPIVQSYLDICVTGCQELEGAYPLAKENEFTYNFFTKTDGWSEYWVNDRIYPRRPHIYQPNARDIDKLINQYQPELFKKIQIEPASQSNVQISGEEQVITSGNQVIIIKDNSK